MGSSLVLLPTYNERENLARLLPRLSSLEEEDLDVLVIDDASPDGTGELAEALRSRYPHLSVLHRKAKEGLGRAYIHGFKLALKEGYRRIVTMDADLSHAPEDVPRLLAGLEEANVAVGSRHAPGGGVEAWPLSRRILSRAGSLYARALLRLPVSDATSGFRAYRAETIKELNLDLLSARGFVFQVEILRRILDLAGARAIEVPILFKNRTRGISKLTSRIIAEAALDVARLSMRRKHLPDRVYPTLEERKREFPQVSVIVAAHPENETPDALMALPSLEAQPGKVEVLVTRGLSPSRQRNEAVKGSSGDFLLFLDDDSLASPDLLSEYLPVFQRDPTVGAVGGPSEATPGKRFQRLASQVLGDPWVVGKTAARYRSLGRPRFTDERELILCNLCVRRKAFEEAGGFREELYPNEENEFLERLRIGGWRLVYRPEAVVKRPQRRGLMDLLSAIHRYGMGRGRQTRLLASRFSLARLALVFLALAGISLSLIGLLAGSILFAIPVLLYGLYLAILTFRHTNRAGFGDGVLGALLAGLLHGSYALGILRGLVFFDRGPKSTEVSLERKDLFGETMRELRRP